jgi:hypothetical protein
MSKANLLNHEFSFEEMIKIVKTSKSYLPICRTLTQHLCDMVEVAYCKLDLLVKHNLEIETLLASEVTDEKLQSLPALCARSEELYAEIEHLPIMHEEPKILLELLSLSKVGTRYGELLELIYKHKRLIKAEHSPIYDESLVHIK